MSEEPKTLWYVGHNMMPGGVLYGVFDSEEKAKQAIKEHDPGNNMHHYVDEIELNQWITYGADL